MIALNFRLSPGDRVAFHTITMAAPSTTIAPLGPQRKEMALQGALERLAPGPWIERPDSPDGVVTAVRRLPRVDAHYAAFPDFLDARLREALERRGIAQLYSHQAEALAHLTAG